MAAKNIYGTLSTQTPEWWAYAVSDGKVTIVRCVDRMDAVEEKERLKHSGAKTVGFTGRKISEQNLWKEIKARGWKMKSILQSAMRKAA
jgi:hypothetical protein